MKKVTTTPDEDFWRDPLSPLKAHADQSGLPAELFADEDTFFGELATGIGDENETTLDAPRCHPRRAIELLMEDKALRVLLQDLDDYVM